jgi:hypothetical protein
MNERIGKEDNTKIDFREKGSGDLDWIHLAQGSRKIPVAGSCEHDKNCVEFEILASAVMKSSIFWDTL